MIVFSSSLVGKVGPNMTSLVMNVGYFHDKAWHVTKANIKLSMFFLQVAPLVIQLPT
jgi:hypothetical protein